MSKPCERGHPFDERARASKVKVAEVGRRRFGPKKREVRHSARTRDRGSSSRRKGERAHPRGEAAVSKTQVAKGCRESRRGGEAMLVRKGLLCSCIWETRSPSVEWDCRSAEGALDRESGHPSRDGGGSGLGAGSDGLRFVQSQFGKRASTTGASEVRSLMDVVKSTGEKERPPRTKRSAEAIQAS